MKPWLFVLHFQVHELSTFWEDRFSSRFCGQSTQEASCASCRFHSAIQAHQCLKLPPKKEQQKLGPPVVPFYPCLGEGSPANIDYRKSWDPYSNLSTGGPRKEHCVQWAGAADSEAQPAAEQWARHAEPGFLQEFPTGRSAGFCFSNYMCSHMGFVLFGGSLCWLVSKPNRQDNRHSVGSAQFRGSVFPFQRRSWELKAMGPLLDISPFISPLRFNRDGHLLESVLKVPSPPLP